MDSRHGASFSKGIVHAIYDTLLEYRPFKSGRIIFVTLYVTITRIISMIKVRIIDIIFDAIIQLSISTEWLNSACIRRMSQPYQRIS